MHNTGLYFKIKEYQLRWTEENENKYKLDFLGSKLLFLKKSIDYCKDKQLNFLPWMKENDYVICGT